MAFSLTNFKAYGLPTAGAVRVQAIQVAELHITALAADVALDIGTNAGTFWTAAQANATFGGVATSALDTLVKVQAIASALTAVQSEQLLDRLQAAAASGTSYTLTVSNLRPVITCAAANGETSWKIRLEWMLKDGYQALTADLGGTV
jgi:hypothetical protein